MFQGYYFKEILSILIVSRDTTIDTGFEIKEFPGHAVRNSRLMNYEIYINSRTYGRSTELF